MVMTVTGGRRRRLYDQLSRVLGPEAAETLMSHLPDSPSADLQGAITDLSSELGAFKTEMYTFRDEMYTFRDEMYGFRDEMYGFRDEMYDFQKEMVEFRREMYVRLDGIDKDINRLYGLLRTNTAGMFGGFAAIIAAIIVSGVFG